ncbi:MAG: AI-2E family transporter [Clostridiales bacterium]|nr:AI-2E family transporter [Clostridiales bacterium]
MVIGFTQSAAAAGAAAGFRAAPSLLQALAPLWTGLLLAFLLCPLARILEDRILQPLFPGRALPAEPLHLVQKEETRTRRLRFASALLAFFLVYSLVALLLFGFLFLLLRGLHLPAEEDLFSAVPDSPFWQRASSWFLEQLSPQLKQLPAKLTALLRSLADGVVNLVLGTVLGIYLTADRDFFLQRLRKLSHLALSMGPAAHVGEVLRRLYGILSLFLRGQLLDSLVVAVLSILALALARVPLAPVLGLFAGICNVIPYFGPVIALIPAVLITLGTGGPGKALLAALLLIAIQQIDSNLIYPKLVGSSMGLHPVTVLTAVFAGGVFWGTAGMLLAVPAAAFLKVLAKKVLSFWPD